MMHTSLPVLPSSSTSDHLPVGPDAEQEPASKPKSVCTRRDVLQLAAGAMGAGLLSCGMIKPALALPSGGAHRVYFRHAHTGESFNGVYRVGDKYLPEAFDQITHILRDSRNGETFPIDPRTIDIIYVVQRMLEANEPFQVLSGYRSPRTNAMLARVSYGVARHSLHMTGQAIDVRMEGMTADSIRNAATSLHAGGVGYYPKSNFVHMDSGNFRTW